MTRQVSSVVSNQPQIQEFEFNTNQIRVIDKDGDLWFIAKDACDVLDIKNSRQALSRLEDDEKDTVILNDGIQGNPEKAIVNEFGLYNLILSSRKKSAKEFKRWVTHEVLPSIRKTGSYSTYPPVNIPLLPVDIPLADLDLTEIHEMLKKECWVKIEFMDGRFMLSSKTIADRLNGIHKPMLRHIFGLIVHNKKLKSHFEAIGPNDYDVDWAPYPEYYYMDKEGFWMTLESLTLNKRSRFFIKRALEHFNELEATLLSLKNEAWERLRTAEIERKKNLPNPSLKLGESADQFASSKPWSGTEKVCQAAYKAYLDAGGLLHTGDDYMKGLNHSIGMLLTLSFKLQADLWMHRKASLEAKKLISYNN